MKKAGECPWFGVWFFLWTGYVHMLEMYLALDCHRCVNGHLIHIGSDYNQLWSRKSKEFNNILNFYS